MDAGRGSFPVKVFERKQNECTIASKINVAPKGVKFPISKLHSILAVANILAHNNISQICYCGQVSLLSDVVNCSFSKSYSFGGNNYFAGDGTLCAPLPSCSIT